MKRTVALSALALVLLNGCAQAGSLQMPDLPDRSSQAAATPAPLERFSYGPASNQHVQITVGEVVMQGDDDFLPSDPNWLQVRMTIRNVGDRTISFTSAKEQLADGTVIASAAGANELTKAPSMVGMAAGRFGIEAVGLAGSFLFPPAILLAGAASLFRTMSTVDRQQRLSDQFSREGLQPGPIAPGTNTSGNVFVPAVAGQTALIVFYDVGGSQESLVIPRTSN